MLAPLPRVRDRYARRPDRRRSSGSASPSPTRALEIPSPVDLDAADLVTVEAEDLRVAEARAVGPRRLVGDDHLVPVLELAHDLVAVDAAGVGPTALPVRGQVDPHVGRRGE